MIRKTLTFAIQNCLQAGDKAFIPYIMAGDGDLTKQILFLQHAGVTAIEIGIPFSDPVADGPTIQRAGERALQNGATLRTILNELRSIKEEVSVPLIIMSYINPILSYGVDAFAEQCKLSGISGLIIPDVPLEESDFVKKAFLKTDVAFIQLVSLTSPLDRLERIASAGEGFLYAVTINGTTGVRDGFADQLENHLKQLKEISLIPVLAGFGISTAEQVGEIGLLGDGVIVGSAIVEAFHQNKLDRIKELIQASKSKVVI